MTASGFDGAADALGDAVVGETEAADADGDGAPVLVHPAKANIATSATLNVLLVLTVALLLWIGMVRPEAPVPDSLLDGSGQGFSCDHLLARRSCPGDADGSPTAGLAAVRGDLDDLRREHFGRQ